MEEYIPLARFHKVSLSFIIVVFALQFNLGQCLLKFVRTCLRYVLCCLLITARCILIVFRLIISIIYTIFCTTLLLPCGSLNRTLICEQLLKNKMPTWKDARLNMFLSLINRNATYSFKPFFSIYLSSWRYNTKRNVCLAKPMKLRLNSCFDVNAFNFVMTAVDGDLIYFIKI